tara:strand:+ start:657 stop:1022 length:366 start_codon:yes stop_codon:yes gene_type:complete
LSKITIYHNPKCSNSRGALELLRETDAEVEVIEYLKSPLDVATIAQLLDWYSGEPIDLVRLKEPEAAQYGVSAQSNVAEIIVALAAAPVLIQRPLVIYKGQLIIARPPSVLDSILFESERS